MRFRLCAVCVGVFCPGPVRVGVFRLRPVCVGVFCLCPVCVGVFRLCPVCVGVFCLRPVCVGAFRLRPVCTGVFRLCPVCVGRARFARSDFHGFKQRPPVRFRLRWSFGGQVEGQAPIIPRSVPAVRNSACVRVFRLISAGDLRRLPRDRAADRTAPIMRGAVMPALPPASRWNSALTGGGATRHNPTRRVHSRAGATRLGSVWRLRRRPR